MTKESIYKRYIPGISMPDGTWKRKWWFAFSSGKMLVHYTDGGVKVPCTGKLEDVGINPVRTQYLGLLEGIPCCSAELKGNAEAPEGMAFMDIRSLFGLLDDDIFLLSGKASQVVSWDQTHQFCGRCGSPTVTKQDERAKLCPKCGFMSFTRLSPAVIVAVTRGDKLLLAHNKNFAGNRHSVIAGFVEAGETFEECVKREIMEEVGIRVKNITYFGSQPWPFPNSLMVGFTAEYEGGEITVDGVEIERADWYTCASLPDIPTGISISRALIDWFVQDCQKRKV